jgi:hypothetical protein
MSDQPLWDWIEFDISLTHWKSHRSNSSLSYSSVQPTVPKIPSIAKCRGVPSNDSHISTIKDFMILRRFGMTESTVYPSKRTWPTQSILTMHRISVHISKAPTFHLMVMLHCSSDAEKWWWETHYMLLYCSYCSLLTSNFKLQIPVTPRIIPGTRKHQTV